MSQAPCNLTPDARQRVEAAARELLACAEAWEPDVCLFGNVRADEIASVCRAALVSEAVVAERGRWEDECLDALRSVYPAGRNRAAVVEAIRRIGQTDPARPHPNDGEG